MRPVLFALVLAAACSRAPAEPAPSASSPASTSTSTPTPTSTASTTPSSTSTQPFSSLALRWSDPARWTRRTPATPARAAEYSIPRVAPDREDGECIVITFGADAGGDVDDNVDRWAAQLKPASGPPVRRTRQVNGMFVTRVEIAGTYLPMKTPGLPALPAMRPGWRLVGLIVQSPSGLWFFKTTGPDATVRNASPEIDALADSMHPG